MERYNKALYMAHGWGYKGEEAKQIARHLFARWLIGGQAIGQKKGKLIIGKRRRHPNLP